MFKKTLILFLTLCAGVPLYATHLLGGIMYYKFIGFTNSLRTEAKYEITLKIYRDCYNGQADYDQPLELGIYDNNRDLERIEEVYYIQKVNVTPVQVANCTTKPNVCIEEAFYKVTVVLHAGHEHHLLYQRCCRNAQNNLQDDMGQSYYCMIPPASTYPDYSPVIIGVPAPYVCAGDTVTYSNAATDDDGDSLVYSIEQPWSGGDRVNPKPSPGSRINLPLALSSYKSGYSNSLPFGSGGMLTINSMTGLTQLLAPNVGQYSFAVVVKEYRKINGVWVYLSEIRRDLQLIVVPCPPNIKPVLVGSGSTYSVEAGDSICFDINYYDPDWNTYAYKTKLRLSATGDILYGTNGYTGPRATLTQVSSQSSNIVYKFCWKLSCIPKSLARGYPYNFNVTVNDSGCPPKSISNDFYINVTPYVSDIKINGPDAVCEGRSYSYTATSKKGVKFNWSVFGPGTIVGGQGTNNIIVRWNNAGTGTVIVNDTTALGCVGDPVSKPVTISTIPFINYGITGDSVVCEKTIEAYSVPVKPSAVFYWTITGGSQISGLTQIISRCSGARQVRGK
jgi:hypothetical protein